MTSRNIKLPMADPPPSDVPRVSLLDLKPNGCRYPLGDVGQPDFGFCGEPQFAGSSYCEYHHCICSTPIKPSANQSRPFLNKR